MDHSYSQLPSPCYILSEEKLRKNLKLINYVQESTDCQVILALKGFAMWSAFPIVREYLAGCSASSYNEVRLAHEHFAGHVHLYAPAYTDQEFPSLLPLADRISFNSLSQWQRFSQQAIDAGKSCGLRVNPAINEVETKLYNPSSPDSRLGVPAEDLKDLPKGVDGLHAHALCESSAESSERLIKALEDNFGQHFEQLKWINLGGGHLMTRKGYDIDRLIRVLKAFRQRYPWLEITLEPGSAIAWQTGPLLSTVLDIITRDGIDITILDTSATAHMPDVLEMPYRPDVRDAGQANELGHTYRLGGLTCLAGDIIGDYSFASPLNIGDKVIFEDMMHYTMVKTTLFNGVQHPAIAIEHSNGGIELIREFGFDDYEKRLS